MKILISGASGFLGRALSARLEAAGHEIWRLVRRTTRFEAREIFWDPANSKLDATSLNGFQAVFHLAGEGIASGIWTSSRRERIKQSRVLGTSLLAHSLTESEEPPAVFISASAIGYYGSRGDEILDENSPPGSGFLADVCQAWEQASRAAAGRGIRLVWPRIGLVLDPGGGLLQKMLPVFRLGLGGRIGAGQQFMSWITATDVCRAFEHCLRNETIIGPVNCVSPQAVTNAEFTAALGKALHRPTPFPVPAALLGLLPGNMGDEMFLASARVLPKKLLETGFLFEQQELSQALGILLRR